MISHITMLHFRGICMLEWHRLFAYSFFDCFEDSNEAVRKCVASEATLSDFKQNQPSQNQPDQGNHKKNCCICLFYHVLPPFRDARVTLPDLESSRSCLQLAPAMPRHRTNLVGSTERIKIIGENRP